MSVSFTFKPSRERVFYSFLFQINAVPFEIYIPLNPKNDIVSLKILTQLFSTLIIFPKQLISILE